MTNDIVKGAVERLTQPLINIKEKWVVKGHWDSMSKAERKNVLRVGIAYELSGEITDLKGGNIGTTYSAIQIEVDNYIDTII